MIIREMYFTMTDGVRLYTRIVLPAENQAFPLVLIRTPYEAARNGEPYPPERYQDNLFLKNGYAIVLQHVRGRGDSEGDCIPYRERQDGLDTLELLRTQPFYNGEIYLTGASYLATAHLCYLDTNQPDIKAAALSIQQDRMFHYQHHNGCCRSFCGFSWYLSMMQKKYPVHPDYREAMYRPYVQMMERTLGEDVPSFTNMLLNDTYNDFWKAQEDDHAVDQLTIPVLLTGGWYDYYTDGMFSMWERLPEQTREQSALIMGPWGHALQVKGGEYPLENGEVPPDFIVQFFNSVRDGTPYPYYPLGNISYYSVGGGFWTTAHPQDRRKIRWYFGADGTLNERLAAAGERSYCFDPDKPLNYYRYLNIFQGPEADSNEGVLSFVSPPAEEELHFYGRMQWNMRVKSDCDDTAFFLRIYFVEDRISYNLTEAITSLSYANPNYRAGEECLICVETAPIGFTLKKGSCIRADISSHSDLYVPHSNTKENWARATEAKIANNTVICCEESYLTCSASREIQTRLRRS